MKAKKVTGLASSVVILFLLLALGASAVAAATTAPNGGQISGLVTSPGGYPLEPGTLVKLFDADAETVRGEAVPNPSGEFQLGPVSNGLYVIKAIPPAGSPYTQSLPKVVSVVNAPVDVGVLAISEPQVVGSVFAPDGSTLVDSDIFVHLGDGQVIQHVPAPGGAFKIGGLPVGGYALQAFARGEAPYWKSAKTELNIVSLEDEQILDLTLREADLWGYIQDDQGNPVREARVIAEGNNLREVAWSNASGFWTIGGLTDGAYRLTALPPWLDSGLLPPVPLEVTVPSGDNPYTLSFLSPPKIVEGIVSTNTGVPVLHAMVLARRVDTPGHAKAVSAADGSYELRLAPGLWALTIQPMTDTIPSDWVYFDPPQYIFFHHDNDPETRTKDFTVTLSDGSVIGVVQMPDGSPLPFTVTVALHNDEGVGQKSIIEPDGSFELAIPNGNYKVAVHPDDAGHVGPIVDPISVPPDGLADLEILTLLARDAVITGTVSADGSGVSGIPLVAWRPGAPGALNTTSGPEGEYALAVSEGDWHIQPAPGPDQPYLYSGSGEDVSIAAGGVIADLDFEIDPTDAVIAGLLVDESGQPVEDAFGWASAFQQGAPQVHNGAPIDGGAFMIHIPAGVYRVAAHLPAGSPYNSTIERQVTAVSGQQVDVTFTVQEKNALISGGLWDPRADEVVTGVDGVVGAWSNGSWAVSPIEDANGTYRLELADGLWRLNFRIDPDAGYAKLGGPWNVTALENRNVIKPLPITVKDGQIQGVVLTPSGDPMAGAVVLAKGVDGMVNDLWLRTYSEEDGTFTLMVPFGRYRLAVAGGAPEWLNPIEKLVEVPAGGISSGHQMQFLEPDNTLSGSLTISDTLDDGDAMVWAWSEDGGLTHGRFPMTMSGDAMSGDYQLDVLSNPTWTVGAAFETSSQYWFGRARVDVGADPATQDLTLQGPFPKPAPVVVTFDAAEPQQISLADGTDILIPAGALPAEGQVTLRIVPVATLPHQQKTNIYRYGYAFLATDSSGNPIEAHFNQEVVISFTYEEAELIAQHIHEFWLRPAYYSTTLERWVFPENFVIDTEANLVVMQIDHFTDYALTAPEVTSTLFLPITLR